MKDIHNLRSLADKLTQEHRHNVRRVKEEKRALREAEEHLTRATEAQTIVMKIAQDVQSKVHNRIAGVVTRCLQTIFEDRYTFQITFERKRGQTEARLSFVEDGNEIDPTEQGSGGVLDVATLGLRLVCLMLARPRARKLLVMDEPMKWLASSAREKIPSLLESLAEETGFQFILVSHFAEMETGKVIQLENT